MNSKFCPKCREEKSVACFSKDKNTVSGLHGWCKACRAVQKQSYTAHRAQATKKPITEKHCSRCKELLPIACFTRDKCSKDGYRSACKKCWRSFEKSEKFKASQRRYLTSDKGRVKSAQATARYSQRRGKEKLSTLEWKAIILAFDGKCAYCDMAVELTADHIIPVSKGGKTTLTNIAPACQSCNSSKRDKDALSFCGEERYLKIAQILQNLAIQMHSQ